MRRLRVDVAGGGPGGLFLARLLRLADPSSSVRVHERNGPDDTFGFGVVFSDRTMSSIRAADPETHELIRRASVSWSDMEVRLPGASLRYGGYGFTAVSRRVLLSILRRQAVRAGAEVRFHRELRLGPDDGPGHVTVLADGAGSANRGRWAGRFGTAVETGAARYVWFGTEAPFDAVTFPFVPTGYGVFAAHAYPYGEGLSTFIVEADERTWRNAGLDAPVRAGLTDHRSREMLAGVFAEHLGGRPLIGNASRWHAFRVVRNARWSAGNAVLLGDAAHTAHFSVGSGTKLAMEDAIALADALRRAGRPDEAFAAYEAARRGPVARTQALAERSMRWWESFGRRMHLPPHRFGMHFITRTGAIAYAGLRRRHGDRIAEAEAEFAALARAGGPPGTSPVSSVPPDGRHRGTSPGPAGPPDGRRPGTRPPAAVPPGGGPPPIRDGGALGLPVDLGPLRLPTRVAAWLPGGADPRDSPVPRAGVSLVLADLRGTAAGSSESLERAVRGVAARAATMPGAVPGVVLGPDADPGAVGRAVHVGGVRFVEVVPAEGVTDPAVVAALLDRVGRVAAVCAGLRCPAEDAWSGRAGRLLDRCRELRALGAACLHLHDAPPCAGSAGAHWERLVGWADRIRTETGLPVLLDGPDGWAPCGDGAGDDAGAGNAVGAGTAIGDGDDWASRLHVTVVSGRADVVVARPPARCCAVRIRGT
ncbi:FAD-dependent monooxygenase [Planomonospora sp. ID91781]|uniref:FAD-dependent monooxygenase n=1 Tax=Planomonospora sp. ID91781 TaxID=2738135 RepID=UPI0018C41B29|nr:FAD-dependent monooxygenase [Planomonospora sp. ID91781]MBG0823431.1 FAD-dependent monooxygenase [Planomonospora sp. ID91781]